MGKSKNKFVCQACGAVASKWSGQCNGCGSWDTVHEENSSQNFYKTSGEKINFESLQGEAQPAPRVSTALTELDRVLGGGLVPGSAILIGGDPGIGKSTILLQMVAGLAQKGVSCSYISGEESVDQVRLRAKRLGIDHKDIKLATSNSTDSIIQTLDTPQAPQVIIIDSIQTMFMNAIGSAPGTVSQVRACAHELISMAKQRGSVIVLVGHVTKEGQIAGPKVLEHMVDTVLYFEGERGHQFRLLRAVKNRFGAANEIGVFEMSDLGLREVPNPSSIFLSDAERSASGSSVFAGMEGTRPVLVEVQALVAPSLMATPRRAVVGWDQNRLAMIIAVLATRYGVSFMDKEVYLNIAGGLKITEPAADLAVATALLSAYSNIPLPKGCVVFGEIGLSGEIRQVSHADIRLKEAGKLGFTNAILPEGIKTKTGFSLNEIRHIKELADNFHVNASAANDKQPIMSES